MPISHSNPISSSKLMAYLHSEKTNISVIPESQYLWYASKNFFAETLMFKIVAGEFDDERKDAE
jgi:hypothetical protein